MHSHRTPNGATSSPTRRTVAYIRVSTEEQAYEGYSLLDQERAARLYAQARVAMQEAGWTEIDDDGVYADPGVSGTLRDRPGLNRLLADAKAGKIGRVICTKLDRIGRTAAIILSIEDELESYGVQRAYIKDSIDTSTATGRLLRTVLAAVAELEREMILERTTAGKVEAVRRGDVWRPTGLLGYRYLPVDKQTGQRGRLEIDEAPYQAPLIRRIFTDVANGTSLRALAAQLNAEGIPPVRGTMWRHNALERIIRNPAYTGRATYGRWRRVKVGNGKTVVRRGDPDKILYVDVPAIVSVDLAKAAQAMLARNRAMAKRNAKRDYLLGGGLVRCGALLDDGRLCGSVMRGENHRGVTYRCSHAEPQGQRRHTVPAAALEEAVWGGLCKLLNDPDDTVLKEVEALADAGSAQAAAAVAEMAHLERAAREIDAEQDLLLNLYLKRRVDEERYAAKAEELAERRRHLLDQQAAVAARRDAALARQLPVAEIRAACMQIAGRLDTLTFTQKQHLIRTLFTSIIADRRDAHIEGAFASLSTDVSLDGAPSGAPDGAIAATASARCAPPRRRPRAPA